MIISRTQGHFLFPVIWKWLCRQVLSTQFWHLIIRSTSTTCIWSGILEFQHRSSTTMIILVLHCIYVKIRWCPIDCSTISDGFYFNKNVFFYLITKHLSMNTPVFTLRFGLEFDQANDIHVWRALQWYLFSRFGFPCVHDLLIFLPGFVLLMDLWYLINGWRTVISFLILLVYIIILCTPGGVYHRHKASLFPYPQYTIKANNSDFTVNLGNVLET